MGGPFEAPGGWRGLEEGPGRAGAGRASGGMGGPFEAPGGWRGLEEGPG
jgi:hypothetical protein